MDLLNHEEGFGESSMADLAELKKALEIGYTQPVSGFDSLRVESLDATLKILTYSAENIKLWNRIPKSDAFSTIEEYNQLSTYGSQGGGFVGSGLLPEEDDSTYVRASQKVKYLGTTRSIHHPATLVRTVPADLIGQETQNGALWLMGKANNGLYYGDEASIPLEWNGLPSQLVTGGATIIDCLGQPLKSANIEEAALQIANNFGTPSGFFSAPKVFADFAQSYAQYQRWLQPGAQPGIIGTPVTGYNTMAGPIEFNGDVFVRQGAAPAAAPSSPKAPSAPTLSPGAASGTGSKFLAADAATYKWQVTSINQYGESAPAVLSAGQAITTGQSVAITITDGGGAYPATGYRIYRGDPNAATLSTYQTQVARNKIAGVPQATTVFTDDNTFRSKCFIGLMLDMSDQSLTFRQLAPMLKMNLAVTSPALRWMQLLYGTPIIFAPKKNVLFRNIGAA